MAKKDPQVAEQTLSMSESALDVVKEMKAKSQSKPEPEPEAPEPGPKRMSSALQHIRDHPWYGFLSLVPFFLYGYFEYKGLALDLEEKQLALEERRADLEQKSKEADKDRVEIDEKTLEKLEDVLGRLDDLETDMEFTWRVLDSGLIRMLGGSSAPAEDPKVSATLDGGGLGADVNPMPPPKKSARPTKSGTVKPSKRDYDLQMPKQIFE